MFTFRTIALGLVGVVGFCFLVVGAWSIGRGIFGSQERLSSISYGTALLLVGAICAFPLTVVLWLMVMLQDSTHR